MMILVLVFIIVLIVIGTYTLGPEARALIPPPPPLPASWPESAGELSFGFRHALYGGCGSLPGPHRACRIVAPNLKL